VLRGLRPDGVSARPVALPTLIRELVHVEITRARATLEGRFADSIIFPRYPWASFDMARLTMALELLLLLAFVAACLHFGPFTKPVGWSTILTAALGVATLAVQNSGMRLIWPKHPSTTVMTLNLTQLVLDGVVILREPKDATAPAAGQRLALVAPTPCGFLVGAAAGGLGYLIAGFYAGFAPAAVLLLLIFIREEPSPTRSAVGTAPLR
jgi:uncharacterized membrane protein YoaK (UPF0700 family)